MYNPFGFDLNLKLTFSGGVVAAAGRGFREGLTVVLLERIFNEGSISIGIGWSKSAEQY